MRLNFPSDFCLRFRFIYKNLKNTWIKWDTFRWNIPIMDEINSTLKEEIEIG
jgi:hypothetical protein